MRDWVRREPLLAGLSGVALACLGIAAVLVLQLLAGLGGEQQSEPRRARTLPVPASASGPAPVDSTQAATEHVGRVTGTVRDRVGRPVPGISVTLLPAPYWDDYAVPASDTDRRGRYQFARAPVGRYKVRFVGPRDVGTRFAPQFNGGSTELRAAPKVRVRRDRTTRVDATLRIGGTVTSRVLSVMGEPLNASVTLERRTAQGWESSPSAGVSGSGDFTARGLAPGTYRLLAANANRGHVYAAPDGSSSTRADDATLFEVEMGERLSVDAMLPEPGRLVGRVTAPDGEPVRGVTVTLVQDREPVGPTVGSCCISYPSQFTATSAADGTFSITPEDSQIDMLLGLSPLRGSEWNRCGSSLRGAERRVAIAPEQIVERTLVLEEGGAIRGVVTDEDGEPVAGAEVTALPGRGAPCAVQVTARTDRDGRYRLQGLADQNHRLLVSHPGHAASWVGGTAVRAEAAVVRVGAGRSRSGVDHELVRLATVSGTVELRGDSQEVRVCLDQGGVFAVPGSEPCTLVAEDGSFTVRGVRPGNRLVSFHVDHWDGSAPWPVHLSRDGTMTYDPGHAARIEVAPGERLAGVDARLDASASIAGVVLDERGRPEEWAEVTLLRREPGGGWRKVARTLALQDATFGFSSLPGGLYRFASAAFADDETPPPTPIGVRPFASGLGLASGQHAEGVEVQLEGTSP